MAAILVMWPGPFEQLSFPHPMETPYESWIQSAQWFLSRCLKSVDDRRTDDGRQGPTYPKAHQWDFGSGELKTIAHSFALSLNKYSQ